MSFKAVIVAGSLALTALVKPAHADFIVAPNAQTGTEGNSVNGFTFSDIQHYQQVCATSQFSSLGSVGGLITQIVFRPDGLAGGPGFVHLLSSIRIDLSTTGASPDALSMTFTNNVGADNVTVYGGATGAPLILSTANIGPAGGPKVFDIIITLSVPFFYNPALGNLLLDVRNFAGGPGAITFLDAESTAGDSISSIYTVFGSADINSPTADRADTLGLVTGFTIIPVPEPSPYAFCVLAIVLMGLPVWNKRLRHRSDMPAIATRIV